MIKKMMFLAFLFSVILMSSCSSKKFHYISEPIDEFEPSVISGCQISLLPVVDNRSNPMVISGLNANHFDRDVVQIEVDPEAVLLEYIFREKLKECMEQEGVVVSLVENRNLLSDSNFEEFVMEINLKDIRFRKDSVCLSFFEVLVQVDLYKHGVKELSFDVCGQGREFEDVPLSTGYSNGGLPQNELFCYHKDPHCKNELASSVAYSEAVQDAINRVAIRLAYEFNAKEAS